MAADRSVACSPCIACPWCRALCSAGRPHPAHSAMSVFACCPHCPAVAVISLRAQSVSPSLSPAPPSLSHPSTPVLPSCSAQLLCVTAAMFPLGSVLLDGAEPQRLNAALGRLLFLFFVLKSCKRGHCCGVCHQTSGSAAEGEQWQWGSPAAVCQHWVVQHERQLESSSSSAGMQQCSSVCN